MSKELLKIQLRFITFLYLLTIYTPTISHLLVVFSPLRLPVGACSLGGGLPLQLFVPPFPLVFLLHPRCGPLCFPSFSHSLDLHQP